MAEIGSLGDLIGPIPDVSFIWQSGLELAFRGSTA